MSDKTIPSDPRTNFAIVIKMHTADCHRILSDPGLVREWVGATLDKHKLQEEIDYTLTVYRTEAETDTVTERIAALKLERDALNKGYQEVMDERLSLRDENATLRAQVERLSMPVSDEEFHAFSRTDDDGMFEFLNRNDLDALIAARKGK